MLRKRKVKIQLRKKNENDKRIHFASAMTLLEHKDGDGATSGASYLELVNFIIGNGKPANVNHDLEKLWT